MSCGAATATQYLGLGICAGHCLIMYVYIGEMDDSGGILTFYIPSRSDDAD